MIIILILISSINIFNNDNAEHDHHSEKGNNNTKKIKIPVTSSVIPSKNDDNVSEWEALAGGALSPREAPSSPGA